jgi:hypothetical protein
MIVIVMVLFAMALGLGALFLLAKAQKENLGKLYTVSSYVVLTFSALMIVFSIGAGIMHMCCKGCGKHGTEQGHGGCPMMKGSCSTDGKCGATMSSCSKGGKSCSKMSGSCSKGGSSCSMGNMNGGCKKMTGHCSKSMEKKIIKKIHGDSVDVQVEVITE